MRHEQPFSLATLCRQVEAKVLVELGFFDARCNLLCGIKAALFHHLSGTVLRHKLDTRHAEQQTAVPAVEELC